MSGYDIAKKYIGLQEHRDKKRLMELFEAQNVMDPYNPSKPFNPDGGSKNGLPWCAAFVTMCLRESGVKALTRYAAREFLNFGFNVGKEITNAQEGDILVFTRGNNSYEGHVGFFVSVDKKTQWIKVLGGNQQDAVSYQYYKPNRLLGIRREE